MVSTAFFHVGLQRECLLARLFFSKEKVKVLGSLRRLHCPHSVCIVVIVYMLKLVKFQQVSVGNLFGCFCAENYNGIKSLIFFSFSISLVIFMFRFFFSYCHVDFVEHILLQNINLNSISWVFKKLQIKYLFSCLYVACSYIKLQILFCCSCLDNKY